MRIDSAKCTGCGACAAACQEGAIRMIDGKAVLVREDYCDGLGSCLPACPAGAIAIEEREALTFSDPHAVPLAPPVCPGSGARTLTPAAEPAGGPAPSRLGQWPVQLRLLPAQAPFYRGADLLVAADCAAYACGDFHERFIRGRIVIIGCPKLDPAESWAKLTAILRDNDVRSVTAVRMEVPCCGGLAHAAEAAVAASGKRIPLRTVTLTRDGKTLD